MFLPVKTMTYAVMHFTVAFLVAFALTRSLAAATAIGFVEPAVQTVAYGLHERVWALRGVKVLHKMGQA